MKSCRRLVIAAPARFRDINLKSQASPEALSKLRETTSPGRVPRPRYQLGSLPVPRNSRAGLHPEPQARSCHLQSRQRGYQRFHSVRGSSSRRILSLTPAAGREVHAIIGVIHGEGLHLLDPLWPRRGTPPRHRLAHSGSVGTCQSTVTGPTARPSRTVAAPTLTPATSTSSVFGHRYGGQPANDNPANLSITHLEFRRAGVKGIPRIALIQMNVPHKGKSDMRDPVRWPLVLAFEDEVRNAVRTAEFTDHHSLDSAMLLA